MDHQDLALNATRPHAVAGSFYPASPTVLNSTVAELLLSVRKTDEISRQPKALIVPHAGYVYSGQTAASAYALLQPYADIIKRVILLGPTHRVAVHGLAIPASHYFETPLGKIEIDQEALASLKAMPQIVVSDEAHALEHSLEVQLPFLQKVLGSFKLVPLAVGSTEINDVADVINTLWGGPETLVVISSDLSHFHSYEQARQIDTHTVNTILSGKLLHSFEQACGALPIDGLLVAAQAHGLQCHLIDICNSGDMAGDRSRVVGYASFSFTNPDDQPKPRTNGDREKLTPEQGQALPAIARAQIGAALGLTNNHVASEPWLEQAGAVFVTLRKQGELRGCIGSLQSHRSLFEDLKSNALGAAFHDPRFPAVTVKELDELQIEVSVIGPSMPITFDTEADALSQMTPGADGIILEYGRHRSTFLPQVWEQLPERREFMAHLKMKAGLPTDFWAADIRLSRYQVTKWSESAASMHRHETEYVH